MKNYLPKYTMFVVGKQLCHWLHNLSLTLMLVEIHLTFLFNTSPLIQFQVHHK